MRPPRLRLRTLLIAVTVAAVATGAEALRRRRAALLARAAACGGFVAVNRAMIGSISPDQAGPGASPEQVRRAIATAEDLARRRADHYERLRRAYLRAADRPWLPVAPEPPPP
jgi:hypothetical protein